MSTNELIERLDLAARTMAGIDPATWSDPTLRGSLDEVSSVLVRIDGELARLADAIRARGLMIAEPAEAPAGTGGRRPASRTGPVLAGAPPAAA